jgi:hypothetical protein
VLLKCVYIGVPIWNDDFTSRINGLQRGEVVLGLGEERRPRVVGHRLGGAQRYSKVFYRGNTGWVSQAALEEVTEPLEESRASK